MMRLCKGCVKGARSPQMGLACRFAAVWRSRWAPNLQPRLPGTPQGLVRTARARTAQHAESHFLGPQTSRHKLAEARCRALTWRSSPASKSYLLKALRVVAVHGCVAPSHSMRMALMGHQHGALQPSVNSCKSQQQAQQQVLHLQRTLAAELWHQRRAGLTRHVQAGRAQAQPITRRPGL